MEYLQRCWARVDLDALEQNARQLAGRLTGGCRMMAVVKADAYGHGDRQVAAALERSGQADWFGVSNIEEALSLRQTRVTKPILIFGPTPATPRYAARLAGDHLTQTVFDPAYAKVLEAAAQAAKVTVDVQVKVDTGMTRLGFATEDADAFTFVKELYAHPAFHVSGLYTHFASADEKTPDGIAYTAAQHRRFADFCDRLAQAGVSVGLRHCCNSAGTILYPTYHMDMVRVGIALYGLYPAPALREDIALRPVMSLLAAVSMVKEIKAGTPVSYGRTFTAPRDMRVATLPVGYADGYTRDLSSRARVILRGAYAPVIGRVCMDQLMVDVSEIPGVSTADIAIVAGTDGNKTADFEELAALSGTIPYEKVCLVGKRVPRVYLRAGEEVDKIGFYPDIP